MKTEIRQKQKRRPFNAGKAVYAVFLLAVVTVTLVTQCFAAGEDMWVKATEIMKDVYGQVVAISTVAAVVTAAIALLLMNFSKNSRTVDESRAWLKRILISWAIINGLGFIMAYVTPFFSGGQYTV